MHTCEKTCHWGYCGSCTQSVVQTCYCKREKRFIRCTKENKAMLKYSCGQPCAKQLKCGNHKCQYLCHAGACADCELLPENVKTCPCGMLQIEKDQRTSCTDPIPLCTASCKMRLTCGQPNNPHTCASKCHYGPCPPCNKQIAVKCLCNGMGQDTENNRFQSLTSRMRIKRRQHFHVVKCSQV